MKRHLLTILLACLGLSFTACDNDVQSQDDIIGNRHAVYPYFFFSIFEPSQLEVSKGEYTVSGRTTTSIDVSVKGKLHNQDTQESNNFVQLASAIGDHPQSKGYVHILPAPRRVLSTSVTGLSIVAKTNYNATHPAGSSLADIVTLSYASYRPQGVDQDLNLSVSEALVYGNKSISLQGFQGVQFPTGHLNVQVAPEQDTFQLFRLQLTEAASTSQQEFHITLRLANGTVLERSLTTEVVSTP